MDESDDPSADDRANPNILITNKAVEDFDAVGAPGIKSSYCTAAIRDGSEGEVITRRRELFCSCSGGCLNSPGDSTNCAFQDNLKSFNDIRCFKKEQIREAANVSADQNLEIDFFSQGGPLRSDDTVVIAYSEDNQNVNFGLLTILPYKLASKKVVKRNDVSTSFAAGTSICAILPLKIIAGGEETSGSKYSKAAGSTKIYILSKKMILTSSVGNPGVTRDTFLSAGVQSTGTGRSANKIFSISTEILEDLNDALLSRE